MNRIYRLIWNTALNCWMVASEHTKGQGKRATRTVVAVSLVMLSMPALAVEKEVDEDGYEAVQELPAAQPWLPGPYPFATGMDARAVSTLAVRNQTAFVSDDSYRNATISGNNSIILGSRSSISGAHGVAYGNVVEVNGNMASAVGAYAKALANGATVFGAGAQVTMADAVAVGRGSAATAYDAVAIGFIAKAGGQDSTAVGRGASSAGMASIALGGNADAPASHSIAIGGSSTVISNSADAVALGYGAKVDINGAGSLALGARSVASGGNAVAIGQRASVTTHGGVGGIAIGADAAAGAPGYSGAIAVGSSSKATFNGVALGQAAQATASSAVALGQGSVANVSGTVSVGNATTKRKIVNVADGTLSASSTDAVTGKQLYKATQDVGTAISTANTAKSTADAAAARLNDTRTAIGRTATAAGTNATAVGQGSAASGSHSHAFGTGAKAAGDNAAAVGTLASAASYDAIAVGNRATVVAGSVGGMALGANAAVNANAGKAVALGANSVATELDAVSVGNATLKRKIVNVADGVVSATSTDAVTGKQLYAVRTSQEAIRDTANAVAAKLNSAKTALGLRANAEGVNATAVGYESNASGSHGTAVGRSAAATGEFSIAMGSGSQASRKSAVAVGNAADASGDFSAAMGYKAGASGGYSAAFGYEAAAAGASSVALGSLAKSNATHSIALGDRAQVDATATEAVALGRNASVSAAASGAVALGHASVATEKDTISVGSATLKRRIVNVANGAVTAASTEAVTGGQLHATDLRVTAADDKAKAAGTAAATADQTATAAKATADASKITADAVTARLNNARTIIGQGASAVGVNANAIGYDASATGSHSNAMGHAASTAGANAVAVGTMAAAGSDAAVAVGNRAAVDVTAARGLALGNSAKVNASATDAVALGAGSVASVKETVSVGSSALQRRIVNVADGTLSSASTDAVTGKQLFATNQRVDVLGGLVNQASPSAAMRLGADNSGTTLDVRNKSNAGRVITGLADGAIGVGSKEAVTGGQLFQQQQLVSTNTQRIDANLGRINSNQTGVGTNRDAIAGNRSNIGVNGEAIAKLRSEFDAYAPELDGVVMFNDDRTRVDMEGARVTGVLDGEISSGSKDAVTGGQLFNTNGRVGALENMQSFVQVGSDGESEAARAGWLAVAIGDSAQASTDGAGATAIGSFASAHATNSVALGRGSTVARTAEDGFALGSLSRVDAAGGLAIGGKALVGAGALNGVALGSQSAATEANTVSVGNDRLKRRISNVAKGISDSDAGTVAQLKGALTALGGGADIDESGTVVDPIYQVNGGEYSNVGAALVALDDAVVVTRGEMDVLDARFNRMFQEEATARTDGPGRLTLGGTHGMVLGNVANGLIAAGSRDAVNGGQLYATNEQVGQNRDAISGLREELSGVGQHGGRSVPQQHAPVVDFGGSRLTGVGAGDISSADSRDAINGGQLFVTNDRVSVLEEQGGYFVIGSDEFTRRARAGTVAVAIGDSAEASLSTEGATAVGSFAKARGENSVALGRAAHVHEGAAQGFALGATSQVEIANGVALGAGAIVRSSAPRSVSLGYASIADEADTVSVGHWAYQRRIVNVANGTADHDAATVGQLKRIASAFGGSVEVDSSGNPTTPSFNVQGGEYRSVGDALSALDSSVKASDTSIGALDNRLNRLFQEEATARTDGPGRLTLGGTQGMVLGNVANGMVAAGSRDAVNGGQLYEVRKDLQGQIDNLADRGERVAVSGRMAAPAPMSAEAGGAMVANAEVPAAGLTPTPVASEAGTPEPVVKAEGEHAVAVGSEGKERSVRHVAKGTADTDAVNVQQLNDVLDRANEYTDLAVEGLNKRLDGMDKRFNRMAAMSSAQSAMAMNTAGLNTYNRLGAGVGHSDGESALAVGYQRVMNERGSATFSLNGAFTNSGEKTVGVGVGIGW